MHLSLSTFALASALIAPPGEELIDQETIARIKMEGFQRSQVMDVLFQLTDVYGPRLHGSENYDRAALWSRDKLREWGLDSAELESWPSPVPGWSLAAFHDGAMGRNVIAEIAGTDPSLKDEVVLVGGHFDSWHSGAGATDNAAGSAVMTEAMRILEAVGEKPRRTIRLGLWGGEEQGYWGSKHHVETHYANLETMELTPAHPKVAAYYNLDNGTGKIRGIYLQGNEAVRPIFERFLEPFAYLGASTLTTENTSGTDHLLFDAAGLPGFQFLQDPIEYDSLTHHTNLDVYDHVREEDLKQAAVIVASVAYLTAMRDEKLPRKPLPGPRKKP